MINLIKLENIPHYPKNSTIFVSNWYQQDNAGYSFGDYTAPSHILNQSGVDGFELCSHWKNIETSLGSYQFTYLNNNLDIVKSRGKKVGLLVHVTSFSGNQSYAPNYIRNDHLIYGGSEGHGGELQNHMGYYRTFNFWNPNAFNRWKALIDAISVEFDGKIEYFYLDEMATELTAESISLAGGAAAIQAKQIELYEYAKSKFNKTTVFLKMNFLSGDNTGSRTLQNIISNKNSGGTVAVELALPSVYDPKYPKPVGSNVAYISLDHNMSELRKFPSDQRRYLNTDVAGSTWSSYTTEQARNMLNYGAYCLTGCDAGIYRIMIPEGTITSPAWLAVGPMLNARYLRY